jgi:hypothetical protein
MMIEGVFLLVCFKGLFLVFSSLILCTILNMDDIVIRKRNSFKVIYLFNHFEVIVTFKYLCFFFFNFKKAVVHK